LYADNPNIIMLDTRIIIPINKIVLPRCIYNS
jgi:hypothetical protein